MDFLIVHCFFFLQFLYKYSLLRFSFYRYFKVSEIVLLGLCLGGRVLKRLMIYSLSDKNVMSFV